MINAPAGAGKTRVLAEIAKAWREAGLGPVIGITASQSARNTLAAGGIESYNSARFLGHLPGRRGANGHMPVSEGTLFAVDEASMMPSPDLADLIDLAERHGGKVIVAGDTEQLQAVKQRRRHVPARRPPRLRPADRSRCGSAPRGSAPPACGSATATPPSWTNTTSTPGSPAGTRS